MRKRVLYITMSSLLLNGCVNDNDFTVPDINCVESEITITNSIAQVKDMAGFGLVEFTEDIIISGFVISSDAAGNIYKTISIQDKAEDPTAGIRIAVDQNNTYTQYPVGRKIFIKLKGLAMGYNRGVLEIGKAAGTQIERIPLQEIDQHIIRSCSTVEIVPKKVQMSALYNDLTDLLVQFENVQFRKEDFGKAFANVDNTNSVDRAVTQVTNNCELLSEITLRNSGFSIFKNEDLPQGRGELTGVLTKYYSEYQLLLRDVDDLNFNQEHCDISSTMHATLSFEQLVAMYQGTRVEFGVDIPYVVEGYVISSDREGNFKEVLFVQDATENPMGGIRVLHEETALHERFQTGVHVFIKLNRLYMDRVDGVLTIGYPDGDALTKIEESHLENYVVTTGENFAIIPKVTDISELTAEIYQNNLVTIEAVQLVSEEVGRAFAFYSGTDAGIRTLETCGDLQQISVVTDGNAAFANTKFPVGKGSVTGVLYRSGAQLLLQPRFLEDISLEGTREICPVIVPKILITEIADPVNSTGARFVELYNAGVHAIALDGWQLNKYINGAITKTSIDLSGHILYPNAFMVVANSGFEGVFDIQPNLVSSSLSGNGDDVYELEDNLGDIQDVFGVVGVDGSGTDWEYTDGRAIRNSGITSPSSEFTITEWTVLTPDQQAPSDFNPYKR